MFDFLKKKLNKTIKDASDSIPEEEMTQHDKEFAKDLDNLEEAFNSIEDKYSKEDTSDESSEEESKDETITEEAAEKTKESEEISEEESAQESTPDEPSEKDSTDMEPSTHEESEKEDKSEDDENIKSEESTKLEEEKIEEASEEKKEDKKGRFSFFRRNKKEESSEKEEVRETETEQSTEEIKAEEETTIQEEEPAETSSKDSSEKTEEITDTPAKEEYAEEKKGRFSFFRRNKKEEEKSADDKEAESESEQTSKEEKSRKESKKDEEESGGMFSFITKKTIKEEDIEDILDELFMSLLEGDVAYEVADKIVESVKEDLIGKKIQRRGDMELFTTNALKNAITEIIDNGSYDLLGNIEKAKQNGEPYKIMFVGINGTGKTTTIAKMATYLEKHGYSSVFGASDTFRAGAIEQLEHHAKNLNLKIIKHERNSDPAAVAYDAVEHAKATGKDVVLIDTSGRMQTNANLMDEMKKIKRVSQPDFVMYVGDALMGNDATEQATKFNEVIDIDGIILTKADADAKGGAALSIGHVIHKPILFIGTGQSYDDLMEFKPEWMINLIFEE